MTPGGFTEWLNDISPEEMEPLRDYFKFVSDPRAMKAAYLLEEFQKQLDSSCPDWRDEWAKTRT